MRWPELGLLARVELVSQPLPHGWSLLGPYSRYPILPNRILSDSVLTDFTLSYLVYSTPHFNTFCPKYLVLGLSTLNGTWSSAED